MSKFAYIQTNELIALLRPLPRTSLGYHRACIRPRCAMRGACRCARIGEESESWADWAGRKVNELQTLLADTATMPFDYAYEKARKIVGELTSGAADLYRAGAATAGDVVTELADRGGEAMRSWADSAAYSLSTVGKGAGDAYRDFFGVPPWVAILAGIVVLGGVGYLLLTPGGQSVLMGGGKAMAGAGTGLAKLL